MKRLSTPGTQAKALLMYLVLEKTSHWGDNITRVMGVFSTRAGADAAITVESSGLNRAYVNYDVYEIAIGKWGSVDSMD